MRRHGCKMGFVYNEWDYGYRNQPIPVRADFGALESDAEYAQAAQQSAWLKARTDAEAAEAEADAQAKIRAEAEKAEAEADKQLQIRKEAQAAEQVADLQKQIMGLKTAQPTQEIQNQLFQLQNQLAAAKSAAKMDWTGILKKNAPYIALGVGGLFLLHMVTHRRSA